MEYTTGRHNDLPKHKETVCSEIFGRFLARPELAGFTKGEEYETSIKPTGDVSIKILWLDQVNDEVQMTAVVKSLDCSVEYGVVDKKTNEVLHREKIEDLRYKLSAGTSIELTDGSQEKVLQLLGNFDSWFEKIKAKH